MLNLYLYIQWVGEIMIKIKQYSCLLILFLLSFTVFAQQQNEQDGLNDLKTAYINFEQGNYSDAYRYFNQMLTLYPKDPTYNYYTGICLLHLEENAGNALSHLRYASAKKVPDDVYFYLGLAYHRNYQFDEAIKNYEWFEKVAGKKKINDYALENYKTMARNGSYLVKYGKKYSVYSRERIPDDQFYKQYQFNDLEGKFVERDDFFGWEKDSLDEETVLFVPNESAQNEVLYFAAKHKTRNDYDIYRITKLSDTAWSQPENLGDVINTPFDENYPFIHSDGATLFFASKGHYSMGGYDVYKSSWDWDSQTWSEPENIGFPVNSPFDDILYVPSANNKLALVSSNRDCGFDEYVVYKFDPEYLSPYIELKSHDQIKQLALMEVNATLDSRKNKKSNVESTRKSAPFIQPSLEKDFLNKSEYDSLMNLALNYQLKADSIRWIIDDKRNLFDNISDGQSRAKLSNEIIELEQQVYLIQKSSDKCYQRVREIEQQNIASKNITYGFFGEHSNEEKVVKTDKDKGVKTDQKETVVHAKDSLHKIQFYTKTMDENTDNPDDFGLSINIPSRYNASNPIPVNKEVPRGLMYMIQLGAFSSEKSPEVFNGLTPLTSIKAEGSDIRKYYAGKFRILTSAEEKLSLARSKGFKDAYIIAFDDGNVIPISKAIALEKEQPLPKTPADKTEPETENQDQLEVIFVLKGEINMSDSSLVEVLKNTIHKEHDLFVHKKQDTIDFTIKSFKSYDSALPVKNNIEGILKKEIEIHAYFAENQIPLDQARKITK